MLRILSLLLILIPASIIAQADGVHRKVLVFSSEDPDRPAVSLICKALRSSLKEGSPDRVDIYVEYLDNLGFPVSNYENEIVSLLRRKYMGVKFDLIFTIQPTALRVLLENDTEIFQGTPIVFITIDRRDVADLKLDRM